mgnify:CR=1 FL=1
MNKTEWLEMVRHIHARDAAWFFLFCLIVIGIAIWFDMRKEKDDESKHR